MWKINFLTLISIVIVSAITSFLTTALIKNTANAGTWQLVSGGYINYQPSGNSPNNSCGTGAWDGYVGVKAGQCGNDFYLELNYPYVCPQNTVMVGVTMRPNSGNRIIVWPLCAYLHFG